jgi:hypothetical protein
MGLMDRIAAIFRRSTSSADKTTSDEMPSPNLPSELASAMSAERDRAAIVRVCREMYRLDPRAKRIVSTLARDAVRGGFTVKVKPAGGQEARAQEIAAALCKRLDLESTLVEWLRGCFRDGDCFLELGVNGQNQIARVTRKPTMQMHRASNRADGFDDPARAFWWADAMWSLSEPPGDAVWFAEWQMVHARWDHDEESQYGQPLFASATGSYKRMTAGEVDIAVRRKTRSGMKYVHVLEGADEATLKRYKELNKDALNDPFAAVADFFMNRAGGITAVQGDARLQEIADVVHHIDSWWTASPVPKSLIGYGADLNRDILEKQKEQYNEELDPISQWVEDEILRPLLEREWLLAGIVPEGLVWEIEWTSKQQLTAATIRDVADAALRLKALGMPQDAIVSILTRFLPGIDLAAMLGEENNEEGNDAGRVADAADEYGGRGMSNE